MGDVIELDELIELRKHWREDRKQVVFTNGCFDILHAGHITYLQAARAKGDILVVGLNSDSSVRRLKGEKRPIVPANERAEIIAALNCVDYVVAFEEDTAEGLVCSIKPDVYVKGGDYSLTPFADAATKSLPEAEIVSGYGGTIAIIPLVEGRSTTDIIATVLERYGSNCE